MCILTAQARVKGVARFSVFQGGALVLVPCEFRKWWIRTFWACWSTNPERISPVYGGLSHASHVQILPRDLIHADLVKRSYHEILRTDPAKIIAKISCAGKDPCKISWVFCRISAQDLVCVQDLLVGSVGKDLLRGSSLRKASTYGIIFAGSLGKMSALDFLARFAYRIDERTLDIYIYIYTRSGLYGAPSTRSLGRTSSRPCATPLHNPDEGREQDLQRFLFKRSCRGCSLLRDFFGL